ncbi:MAG: hypothetical protein ACT4OY_06690 [Alphaproteobacteria bacterium]
MAGHFSDAFSRETVLEKMTINPWHDFSFSKIYDAPRLADGVYIKTDEKYFQPIDAKYLYSQMVCAYGGLAAVEIFKGSGKGSVKSALQGTPMI